MIKVWDYLNEYAAEKEDIGAAIESVLSSGRLILGEQVKAFERAFAGYCGVSYGVGVNSGTDALFLALKALGIGQGDEVITVPNTAVPTVSAIVSAGATPVFVDIDPHTYLMDPSLIEEAVTERTRCILPVHLYGQMVPMEEVRAIAEKYALRVLEDCAQSHGAEYKGKKAGSLSDLAAFSFYPTKVLGGYGDGGMVVTDDRELYQKLLRLRFYGMEQTYYAHEHGYNSRLDELHAAILLKKLGRLDDYIARRRAIADRYDALLSGAPLALPHRDERCTHVFYLYVCRHAQRDAIIARLAEAKIFLNVSYPWPVHIMDAYRYLGYAQGSFPRAEAAAKEIFSLPMYPSLSEENQLRVIEALTNFPGW